MVDLPTVVGAGVEIRSNTTAEVDRFANINDLSGAIFHQVASWFGWEGIKYV
jgi:hypothetical protein